MNLYCILHEEMTESYRSPEAEFQHTTWEPWTDPESRQKFADMIYCEYPLHYAYCPPPPFDLDEYIERVGSPPPVTESTFGVYNYDVERDEIIVEDML